MPVEENSNIVHMYEAKIGQDMGQDKAIGGDKNEAQHIG